MESGQPQSGAAAGASTDVATRHGAGPTYRNRFETPYIQARHIAQRELAGSQRMTLSPAVLVHEAFLRLHGRQPDVGLLDGTSPSSPTRAGYPARRLRDIDRVPGRP